MVTKINPAEWIIDVICPICHRPKKDGSKVRKRGHHYIKEVSLPHYCIWCEMEKERGEAE